MRCAALRCAVLCNASGGLVQWLLELQVWAPLSKLTFGAYLLHPMVLDVVYFNRVQPVRRASLPHLANDHVLVG